MRSPPRSSRLCESASCSNDADLVQHPVPQRQSCLSLGWPPGARLRTTDDRGGPMSGHAVAHVDEINEISDGRWPSLPVRDHFGITSFGVNAWVGRDVGDRLINEHDEGEVAEGQEELYLVHRGRARFELDGERIDAPAGTFVFVQPGAMRTAFAEEPGTMLIALGGRPGEAYEPTGYEIWAPLAPLYEAGEYAQAA